MDEEEESSEMSEEESSETGEEESSEEPEREERRERPPRGDRPMYDAVCSKCGNACQVPFQPQEGRPVYCRNCYRPKKRF